MWSWDRGQEVAAQLLGQSFLVMLGLCPPCVAGSRYSGAGSLYLQITKPHLSGEESVVYMGAAFRGRESQASLEWIPKALFPSSMTSAKPFSSSDPQYSHL